LSALQTSLVVTTPLFQQFKIIGIFLIDHSSG